MTAIWTKDKLDRYWLLQQRARAVGMRLTGTGQGSAMVHLQSPSEPEAARTFDDLAAVEAAISQIEQERIAA